MSNLNMRQREKRLASNSLRIKTNRIRIKDQEKTASYCDRFMIVESIIASDVDEKDLVPISFQRKHSSIVFCF